MPSLDILKTHITMSHLHLSAKKAKKTTTPTFAISAPKKVHKERQWSAGAGN